MYGWWYGIAGQYPATVTIWHMRQIPTGGVVFDGPDRPARIEELVLDPPQRNEVRVRMAAAGVCHSDLHVVDGEWERPAGVVLGHEGSAWVESLGEGVAGLEVGDLVVLAWTAPCATCSACERGEPWLCATPDGAGHRLSPELQRLHRATGEPIGAYSGIGTFGEHQVVARSAAIKIDPRTPPEIAALIGCAVTTGIGAVRSTAHVQAGESVTVIGLGGVGLSAVMGATSVGAHPITAIDASPAKLDLAVRAGAHRTLLAAEAAQAAGADHVLECIGLVDTIEMAIELVRPGGTVTLVGMTPQRQRASFDVYRLVEEGKRIIGSNYGSAVPARDFPRIATDYLEGRLPLDLLLTQRIRLEDLDGAFAAMRRGDGARRVIVY
jgi:S-(hydroxymethyl)glutathione dehydrogenase/alcohol dehydrogenase